MSQERAKYQYVPANEVIHDCRKCACFAEIKIIHGQRHAVHACKLEKAMAKESRCSGQCSLFQPVEEEFKEENISYKWDPERHQFKFKVLKPPKVSKKASDKASKI